MNMSDKDNKDNLEHLRHSCAHLLAAAVLEIYPDAKLAIGPAIDDGFYYDIDFGDTKVSEDDLPKIEDKMHELVKSWDGFEKIGVNKDDALKEFKDNPYKTELIEDFAGEEKDLTIYKSGEFRDLCKGGHIENPSNELKHFKLTKIAGAYWRGDENNIMLTRIYGTAFPTKKELSVHLNMLEEAKKRDHKKLGPELELFMFHETSPGMPYWLPKGLKLYNELVNYWRDEHEKHGYQEIASPLLNKSDLYVTSGHWEHYKEDMFLADMGENEVYGIKPMNCPNAMVVFGSKTRSYKDLPLRLSDTDRLHRYERSGTLNGLLRVRSFQQDDSHNYISKDMIADEYEHIFELCEKFYGIFDLDFKFRLGTRPEKFLGKKETWDKAEEQLKKVLKESKREYFVEEGDGAFYGPKVDIVMKDALGRDWQMGTIQLDFQQPSRFKLKYVDQKGEHKTPIAVHRVIYGSLERFIGILVEHFAGKFPVWLAPVQVKILPVTDRSLDYANKLKDEYADFRVEVDDRSETLGAKIRDAQNERVPYMIIVGDKEEKDGKVSVRTRGGKDLGVMDKDGFKDIIEKDISEKKIDVE